MVTILPSLKISHKSEALHRLCHPSVFEGRRAAAKVFWRIRGCKIGGVLVHQGQHERVLAKRFGKQPMEECPYITTGIGGTLRANQWMAVMRQVLKGMNSHPEQSRLERIVQTIQSFMK